jgi:hypothetical protein
MSPKEERATFPVQSAFFKPKRIREEYPYSLYFVLPILRGGRFLYTHCNNVNHRLIKGTQD